ncbi:aryl-alcohol oxidase [Coprinopsis sp. MPI-PUGE-AT-0042]|nr:aryl-alcohol oxidase [Coprinopsis sp. MPI-PUGE-AT-0042]
MVPFSPSALLVATCAVAFLHLLPAFALLANDFSWFPPTEYDFVIVGGGTAGSTLASRLSEIPSINVLLIEVGGRSEGVLDSAVPAHVFSLYGTELDWAFTNVPQPALNNRTEHLASGRGLGGSSATNGLIYTRGSTEDWNRYAKVTGDDGWAWNRILPYFLKSERWTTPSDAHNTGGQYDPAFHSDQGVLGVSLSGAPEAVDTKVMEASRELGGEFKFDLDMNDGKPMGLGWAQSTIANGTRVTSATAYLGPSQMSRNNLHVLVNHRVTSLRQTKRKDDKRKPAFRTVAFRKENSTTELVYQVKASKEVILCAGAYGTPHLLLLSGIGDPADLRKAGVEPVHALPSVGKNLVDHVYVPLSWNIGVDSLIDPYSSEVHRKDMLAQWLGNKSGPLSSTGMNTLGWVRLPQDWEAWKRFDDPAAGTDTPHFELIFFNRGLYPSPGPIFSIWVLLATPKSRGSVTLNASEPSADPLIDANMLESDFDLLAMRRAFKMVDRLLSASTWAEWNLTSTSGAQTDEEFYELIRSTARQGCHPVGTASMSPPGAPYGVVDPDLKVKAISGLRIVDASVLPYVPSGHTQAPVYAIAERAADLIKAAWNLTITT